ncbi:aspartyl-phosphate phosphatase Spo0E family protein [Effusibacillus pohliae]|uniref:aspartyl-phosphate phosphatase Spo0E family protein n=1 Tax=Effusibacillus pohliae TaxID=232270 RepID=UPI000380AEA1
MFEQENLRQLRKEIETIREKLHEEFQNGKSFAHSDIYHLSIMLDNLIVKYQMCIYLKNSKSSADEVQT